MMWASRRQLLGWLLKESPVACWPTTTSHRRKSTLMLPPACWIWPTTRPAAPTPRQSAKRGGALASTSRWMKELGEIDDRDRHRLEIRPGHVDSELRARRRRGSGGERNTAQDRRPSGKFHGEPRVHEGGLCSVTTVSSRGDRS